MILAFLLAYYPGCVTALEPILAIFPDHETKRMLRCALKIDDERTGSDYFPPGATANERAPDALRDLEPAPKELFISEHINAGRGLRQQAHTIHAETSSCIVGASTTFLFRAESQRLGTRQTRKEAL